MQLKIQPLLESKAELTHSASPPGPVVLSSRIRLARNLDKRPFPGWAKDAQRREILSLSEKAIAMLPQMQKGLILEVENLSELERQILVERHLISRELSAHGTGAGVLISADQSCAIMVNEEDHLRIQYMRSGFQLKRIWRSIDAIDTALENHLDYAYSPEIGYLTACPTNVGTGMRASVMLHLPALVLAGQMEKVVRAVNQLGLTVRGLFGEGSDASGSIFQISNQQTLGESEIEIITRLQSVLHSVIEQEENARQRMLESNAEKLFDKIGRALGVLRFGHVLSSSEAMNCLSLLRLAVDLGLMPDEERARIDRLFIEVQPGHIQYLSGKLLSSEQRDLARARFMREQCEQLPPLNFDNLTNS